MGLPAMGSGYNLKQEVKGKLHWFNKESKNFQTAEIKLPGVPEFETDMKKLKEDHIKKMIKFNLGDEEID